MVGEQLRSDKAKSFGVLALWAWIFCGAALSLALPAAAQEETWELTARSFVIMDAKTGKILMAHNPQLMLPPASTVKVMTAMYVLEHLKMDDQVVISPYAAAAPPSKINVKPGEVYTVRELLYALLLSSANDSARALAEKACGSEEAFARKLTQKVREWGAYRTLLANANGLPADHYSTAEDLAILFRRAMQNPEFARIIGTKTYEIQGERELRNHDRFLFTTPLARGGKTGFTRASKNTYVGMFQNGDQAIIVSMMGSSKKWADLRALIEKGFALTGHPIAKLEPKEEYLVFAKKHLGNSVKSASSKTTARKGRKKSRVAMGSVAGDPGKRKAKKR